MRAEIFTRKITGKRHVAPKLKSLPPTMAAFRPHCARANYQTALWKAAGMASPPDKDPSQNGWEKKGSLLQPAYLVVGQEALPDEIRNITCCGCKTGCRSALCSCTKFALACTDFCNCKGGVSCENPATKTLDEQSEADSSDD